MLTYAICSQISANVSSASKAALLFSSRTMISQIHYLVEHLWCFPNMCALIVQVWFWGTDSSPIDYERQSLVLPLEL